MHASRARTCCGRAAPISRSYIFSQTVFSLKCGVRAWSNGAVVAVLELVVFASGADVMRFLPIPYVCAVACLFGVDIMWDWLVVTWKKSSPGDGMLARATLETRRHVRGRRAADTSQTRGTYEACTQ